MTVYRKMLSLNCAAGNQWHHIKHLSVAAAFQDTFLRPVCFNGSKHSSGHKKLLYVPTHLILDDYNDVDLLFVTP